MGERNDRASAFPGAIRPVDIRAATLDITRHYREATGIDCVAITPDGRRMIEQPASSGNTTPLERCRLCAELNALKPSDRVDCASVHRYGTYQAERFGGMYIYFCPRNLTHWAAPVRIDGITVASLIGGPVLMIEPEEFLREDILDSLPVPPEGAERLRRACLEVPYIGTTRVRSLAEILKLSARALSFRLGREQRGVGTADGAGAAWILPTLTAPPASQPDAGYPIAKERELLASIAKGDLDRSREILNAILGFIFFYSNNDLDTIKLRVQELVVLLSRAAVEGGASIEEIIGLNNDYLVRIRESESVYDLSASLSVILTRFVDCMFTLKPIKHADLIRKSLHLIHSQYAGPLSLEKVAESVHLSPTHFSRIFHEETGVSFVSYLTRVRIEKGKALLRDRSIPLAEIGASIGFKDQSYFTRVFKRSTGISPGRYREIRNLGSASDRIDESNIEIHER